MRVNLNKLTSTANFQAKPPPIPNGIKATVRNFSIDDWEEFFMHYWAHFASDNPHLIRDVSQKASLGLKNSGDIIYLNKGGRKY